MRRWVPIAVALLAASAQAAGATTVAFYAMVLAVPVLAAFALGLFGEVLDARAHGPVRPALALEALLAAFALAFVVVGTAAGSLELALWGCLGAYAIQTAVVLGAELFSPAAEPRLEG
jgi:hypothetical protein